MRLQLGPLRFSAPCPEGSRVPLPKQAPPTRSGPQSGTAGPRQWCRTVCVAPRLQTAIPWPIHFREPKGGGASHVLRWPQMTSVKAMVGTACHLGQNRRCVGVARPCYVGTDLDIPLWWHSEFSCFVKPLHTGILPPLLSHLRFCLLCPGYPQGEY